MLMPIGEPLLVTPHFNANGHARARRRNAGDGKGPIRRDGLRRADAQHFQRTALRQGQAFGSKPQKGGPPR